MEDNPILDVQQSSLFKKATVLIVAGSASSMFIQGTSPQNVCAIVVKSLSTSWLALQELGAQTEALPTY